MTPRAYAPRLVYFNRSHTPRESERLMDVLRRNVGVEMALVSLCSRVMKLLKSGRELDTVHDTSTAN